MIFEECDFHISSIVSMISIGSISSSCLEKAGLKPRGVLDASRFGAGSQKVSVVAWEVPVGTFRLGVYLLWFLLVSSC